MELLEALETQSNGAFRAFGVLRRDLAPSSKCSRNSKTACCRLCWRASANVLPCPRSETVPVTPKP